MFSNITTVQLAPFAGYFGLTALAALCMSVLIVLTSRWHGHLSMDSAHGVQKSHLLPTPRVGGVGIYGSLLLAWLLLPDSDTRQILGLVVLAGLPAWLFGLAEDLTKRVGVVPRLLATMFSGAVACMISDVALTRLDIPLVDDLLSYWPLAVLFTAFAVGGVANAINIIDGFHGLASGTSILALLALAVLALLAGDMPLAVVCLLVAAAVAGFWLVNYPWGKLFLGDGGAYFTGFALAWLAVLLPMRNPDTSPWASLMVCAYPFIEVIYSMLRRKLERRSMGEPDSRHLHSLLASQFVRLHFRQLSQTLQNAAVAPMIWAFKIGLVLLAIGLRESTPALAVSLLVAVLAYHLVYRSLARVRPAIPAPDHRR
jgi:UDP-N-acetylmuramyl pentapeptide phosphotransferase/UDP-N-acetylglucosamine-1-phosphate transferase